MKCYKREKERKGQLTYIFPINTLCFLLSFKIINISKFALHVTIPGNHCQASARGEPLIKLCKLRNASDASIKRHQMRRYIDHVLYQNLLPTYMLYRAQPLRSSSGVSLDWLPATGPIWKPGHWCHSSAHLCHLHLTGWGGMG